MGVVNIKKELAKKAYGKKTCSVKGCKNHPQAFMPSEKKYLCREHADEYFSLALDEIKKGYSNQSVLRNDKIYQ